jgi:multisubunit Na+/H+ antiporter MnhF subunit
MHDLVFYGAMIWMTALLGVSILLVIRAPSGLVRVLALDTVTLVLVALLILYSTTTGSSFYLDAALMLALLSFLSTVVAARYHSEGRIF